MSSVLKTILSGAFWSDAADTQVIRADFVEQCIQQLEAKLKRKDEVLREIEKLSRHHDLLSSPQYMIFDRIAALAGEGMDGKS